MAISKLELQKMIKNGESVWYLFGEAYELKTSEHTNKLIARSDDYCYTDKSGVDRECPLDMLYKSRGEAKHYLHHANVVRTEELPFLTWEEFLKEYSFDFYSSNHEWFTLYWNDADGIVLENIISIDDKKTWDLTEANFYKAYDECVRLFRGGE